MYPNDNKEIVLAALYRYLRSNEESRYAHPRELIKYCEKPFSLNYIIRHCMRLSVEELVDFVREDRGEGLQNYFEISDQGIDFVETNWPSLTELIDGGSEPLSIDIPASDRIVTLAHNQIVEMSDLLTNIEEKIKSSNEVGNALGDEKTRLVAEIDAGLNLIKIGKVRALAIYELLVKALRYIAKKITDEGLTELIKLVLAAISKHFGF